MASIRKSSIKHQVYDVIKEKILSQEYALGDPINIVSLCMELDVSNTPVREALTRLESEGLVTSSLNKKVRVVDFDEARILEIDHFFFTLYAGAYVSCIFEDRVAVLIDLMEKAIAQQMDRLAAEDYSGFATASMAFDRCFVEATGNQQLLDYHDQSSPMLHLLVACQHRHAEPNRDSNLAEHQQILAAIKAGDPATAMTVLHTHYNKAHTYAVQETIEK